MATSDQSTDKVSPTQQLIFAGVCLLMMLVGLGVAVWVIVSGQIHKQGIDALFLLAVCLLMVVSFSYIPVQQAIRRGLLQQVFSGKDTGKEDESEGEEVIVESAGANRIYYIIWFYLLAITAIEVALAYVHLFSTSVMLFILMALSIVKAAMIVAYFMHLKFERVALILSLVPATVVVISLLFVFFPDSFRLFDLRVN